MDEEALNALKAEIAAALTPIVWKEMDRRIREGLARIFERRGAPRPTPSPSAGEVKAEIDSGLAAARRQVRTTKPRKAPPAKTAPPAAKPVAPAKPKKGKGELSIDAIRAALTGRPDGLRSEALREQMGLDRRARRRLALVLTKAVRNGILTRKGERRTTTYALKK